MKSIKLPFYSAVLGMMLMASACVQAFTPDKTAEETVQESVTGILSVIDRYGKDKDPSRYLSEMQSVLDPVVGYQQITKGVMGSHFGEASRDQKIRFLKTFKTSLINTYAMGIRSFDGFSIKVAPAAKGPVNYRNTEVNLTITDKNGKTYPMVQSMYYSKSNNGWLMRNVIFNGVNLGITFRNQFDRLVTKNGGDLDKAIAQWSGAAESSFSSADYANPDKALIDESRQNDDSDL